MADFILRIALPVPLHRQYDYLPPAGISQKKLIPGQRLMVPFGNGTRCGLLVAITTTTEVPIRRLKPALKLLDEQPLFTAGHLQFLTWLADYYHHPLGEVLSAALPVKLRKGGAEGSLQQKGWQLTAEGKVTQAEQLARAPRQAQILTLLQKTGGAQTAQELRQQLGEINSILRALQARGLIQTCLLDASAAKVDVKEKPLLLNTEQSSALKALLGQQTEYAAWLLDGITGRGKTEVYLQLATKVLEQGKSVLLLVPEISLTPQLVGRFKARLPQQLAVLHSGLNGSDREAAWHSARTGKAQVVIGTRSAILTPMPKLGLILVDEEHDTSFKQQEGFRYSARDMAVVRARRANCPVVLGSATPSLESLANVKEGKYQQLKLRTRAAGAGTPEMRLLDVRDEKMQGGLSRVLLAALQQTLASGQQAILFLNRRGYAPVVTCYSCGWLSDCPRCDARQTLHAAKNLLCCHHCGSQRRLPVTCPECSSQDLHPLGQGTEQLEQVLQGHFPDYPLIRVDRDSTRRKGSLNKMLKQAKSGEASLLVGTQMLAKGHHFPGVSLVGILDVDGGFFGADYRAAERMAQMIVQVAGRAGRGDQPGKVLIQTRFPEHPLLQTLLQHGYAGFAKNALDERYAAQLPPASYQALLRVSATKAEYPDQFLIEARNLMAAMQHAGVELWGPVPAPMRRRAGQFRAHLLIQANLRSQLHQVLDYLLANIDQLPMAKRVRWSLDVDPQDLY